MSVENIASVIVAATALFLALVGVLGLLKPAVVKSFFGGFATTPIKHFFELLVRSLIGAAFLLHAPVSVAPMVLTIGGWTLIATSAVMAITPWRIHREFAQRTVPKAMRYLPLLSAASLALSIGLAWVSFAGAA